MENCCDAIWKKMKEQEGSQKGQTAKKYSKIKTMFLIHFILFVYWFD